MSTRPAGSLARRRGGFFGEPSGLGVLAFTEVSERFSYYGMAALLALYMSQVLLVPGHAREAVGLDALQHLLARTGARTPAAQAAEIYGAYSAGIYFAPVVGGAVADRWTGRRTAVVLGAVLMCLGHFAMAFPAAFLVALALIVTGCGLLKGNISAQVGALYAETDAAGRSRAFSIFSMAINIGAVAPADRAACSWAGRPCARRRSSWSSSPGRGPPSSWRWTRRTSSSTGRWPACG